MPEANEFLSSTIARKAESTVREIVSRAVSRSRFSREQLCIQLSAKLDRRITVTALNRWSAPGGSSNFPAFAVACFCELTQDWTLLRYLMGPQKESIFELGESAGRFLERKRTPLRMTASGAGENFRESAQLGACASAR